jgi:hypothetical protein
MCGDAPHAAQRCDAHLDAHLDAQRPDTRKPYTGDAPQPPMLQRCSGATVQRIDAHRPDTLSHMTMSRDAAPADTRRGPD